MGTYNGAPFLEEQLDSIATQNVEQIDLIVADDGSADKTPDILEKYSRNWTKGKFDILAGPKQGLAQNYRELLANQDVRGDFIALADQDDVWDDDKLAVAISWLQTQGNQPALYGSRTRYTDTLGVYIRKSPEFRRPPAFGNALVQNIFGANTMVMNRKAFDLVSSASQRSPFVAHDWFCYQIISGAEGAVFYDPAPHINYRQHANNDIGANDSLGARFKRIIGLFSGQFSNWMDVNLHALKANRHLLSPNSQEQLDSFCNARSGNLPGRIRAFVRSGVFRQTWASQTALWFALISNRL